jgi:hypothetical protein
VPGGKGAVVHRDFKPVNILLGADVLDAYLADAGFTKKASRSASAIGIASVACGPT